MASSSKIKNPQIKARLEEFRAAADVAMETGKKLGCDDVKVVLAAGIDRRLVVENGEYSLANVSDSKEIGVLIYKNQKKGSASLNSTDADSIRRAVQDAVSLANFSVADPALTLADPAEAGVPNELDFLYDEGSANAELEALQPLLDVGLACFKRERRLALERFELSSSCSQHYLATTRGIQRQEVQSSVDWDYAAMAKDNEDDVSGMDYDGGFSFALTDSRSKLLSDVDSFIKRVMENAKPGKIASYKGVVLLTPRAVSEILLEVIFYHASGSQVMDGRSRWIESLGKQVVSKLITLVDDPFDATLDGATSYDGDGISTRQQSILTEGVLDLHMHGCYTAKRCGVRSNAMAGGPFGLKFAPGTEELQQLLSARKELLVVDRFSGNSDPLTGAFSGVAKSSSRYVNGVRKHAVTETMIAGNMFDILQQVVGVSRQVENVSGDIIAPYVLVDGITVSGA